MIVKRTVSEIFDESIMIFVVSFCMRSDCRKIDNKKKTEENSLRRNFPTGGEVLSNESFIAFKMLIKQSMSVYINYFD